jgi:undecaprenyl-diphosphatase
MNSIQSIIIGVVEGLTEFLPISSTAHMSITKTLLSIPDANFTIPFEISLQFGAILAAVIYFYKDFLNINTIKRLIITTIPTAIIGFLFKDYLGDWRTRKRKR